MIQDFLVAQKQERNLNGNLLWFQLDGATPPTADMSKKCPAHSSRATPFPDTAMSLDARKPQPIRDLKDIIINEISAIPL